MTYRISVDTGGTFTDVVVTNDEGRFTVGKALTDRSRAFSSIRQGLEVAADTLEMTATELLDETQVFIYGTTRATNGIVEGKFAKTAFLTTEGFPDILRLKEGGKFEPHNLQVEYPKPYIPRHLTFEVPERINAEGEIERPLDEAALRTIIDEFRELNVEAIAVCLLWSIANPIHERTVGELITELLPGVPYTLSHEINPILREYRRGSSTAIDASLKPLMQDYLVTLEKDLREAGYENDILVSTSYGGVMHLNDVIERPIFLVKSGPAMAPVAGLAYVEAEELNRNVIVCDAGGTTFDVSLIRDGIIEFSRDTWIGQKWTGHNLGMASVAVHSVGAGGGSIAWLDSGGLLHVGPQSAGSEPGPACYGRGGMAPTVTDAAVVLGYVNPANFLGGRMTLDHSAAYAAIEGLAAELNESIDRTAFAIMAVANENMIEAIKELTINEGLDPADSVLVAGGGAGGLNIGPIAAELGCKKVLVPRTAGALSASGMQFSDIVTEVGASAMTHSKNFDFERVNAALELIDSQLDEFAARLAERGITEVQKRYFAEARYRFQVWEIEIELDTNRYESPQDVQRLEDEFHRVHDRIFAIRDEGQAVECLSWRGRLIAQVDSPNLEPSLGEEEPSMRPDQTREAYFGQGSVETSIYTGERLAPGASIDGPAIIEEGTSTLVVYPDSNVTVSSGGRYILTPSKVTAL